MKKKILIVMIIIVCIVFCINIYIEIEADKKFNKYSNNPVLGNKDTGTLFDPNVIEIEGKLYMYVSNRNNKSIDVYSSYDGINWNEGTTVLEKNSESGWEDDINRCCVIYQDGKYKMWYTGQKNQKSNIGYAESDNPYNFHRVQTEPVIIYEENYEAESVMNPYVLYDENKEIYRMWYAAGEFYEPDVIAYAESNDGLNWKKYKNNPIYTASNNEEDFDYYKVGGCEVKYFNNEYYMFYIGYTDIHTGYIMCAKSNDGITGWKKVSEEPLVSPTKGEFDADACYKPTVYYNSDSKTIMLWYNGRNKGEEYIGLATYKINILFNKII